MAITGFASLVRHAGRGVLLGLAALAIAGGGLLAAPAAPASAASAITVTISGEHVVRDWEMADYIVKVKNTGTTTLNVVYLEIYHNTLPLDFQSLSRVSGRELECQIVDGSAIGGAKAACERFALGVGDEAVYRLRTTTTLAGFSRVNKLYAKAFYNYPENTAYDDRDTFDVSVNP